MYEILSILGIEMHYDYMCDVVIVTMRQDDYVIDYRFTEGEF